jgi:2-oxoglutarate ferredoxin oxidoreductase subunit beta
MVYILENNGVYGLTKGQFSATADQGSKSKRGAINSDGPIDTVSLALIMGATFVARGFSGDRRQLVPLLRAAIVHKGAAFVDVISPCVAFNNHTGSTRSYAYVREHNEAVNRIDFIETRPEVTADYEEGRVVEILHRDGTLLRLRNLHAEYDPTDRIGAMNYVQQHQARGEIVTGLLYADPHAEDLHEHLHTVDVPFNGLIEEDLCPCAAALDRINASLR